MRSKIYNQLAKAVQEYPFWVAAISSMGADTPNSFVLEQLGVQGVEEDPKETQVG